MRSATGQPFIRYSSLLLLARHVRGSSFRLAPGLALVLTYGGLAAGLTSCSPTPAAAPAVEAPPAPVPYDGRPEVSPRPMEQKPTLRPEWGAYFQKAGVTGAIAVFDTRGAKLSCSDAARCETGYLPASTFKIAHTLIGLENGAVASAQSVLSWDGQQHENEAWNRDHDLRSAFKSSCVPCFQQVARLIGESAMDNWLRKLDYGSGQVTGSIDTFWLTGPLRITPYQQVDFLWRLDASQLPVHAASRDLVVDLLELETGSGFVLRGKAGWVPSTHNESEAAWFVGWVELEARRVYFATILDGHPPDLNVGLLRQSITEQILRDENILPEATPLAPAGAAPVSTQRTVSPLAPPDPKRP